MSAQYSRTPSSYCSCGHYPLISHARLNRSAALPFICPLESQSSSIGHRTSATAAAKAPAAPLPRPSLALRRRMRSVGEEVRAAARAAAPSSRMLLCARSSSRRPLSGRAAAMARAAPSPSWFWKR
eukprot:scaffold2520_cov130-Isochrysis_galbana.AAC.2